MTNAKTVTTIRGDKLLHFLRYAKAVCDCTHFETEFTFKLDEGALHVKGWKLFPEGLNLYFRDTLNRAHPSFTSIGDWIISVGRSGNSLKFLDFLEMASTNGGMDRIHFSIDDLIPRLREATDRENALRRMLSGLACGEIKPSDFTV